LRLRSAPAQLPSPLKPKTSARPVTSVATLKTVSAPAAWYLVHSRLVPASPAVLSTTHTTCMSTPMADCDRWSRFDTVVRATHIPRTGTSTATVMTAIQLDDFPLTCLRLPILVPSDAASIRGSPLQGSYKRQPGVSGSVPPGCADRVCSVQDSLLHYVKYLGHRPCQHPCHLGPLPQSAESLCHALCLGDIRELEFDGQVQVVADFPGYPIAQYPRPAAVQRIGVEAALPHRVVFHRVTHSQDRHVLLLDLRAQYQSAAVRRRLGHRRHCA